MSEKFAHSQGSRVAEAQQDFELEAVPADKRRSFWSITVVWTGYVFLVTSMMAGGGLASGLSMGEIVGATLAGNIFLSAVAVLISYIACTTGLTFALITRHSFGCEGSRAASLFAPLINLGWYTIQSALYGHLIAQIFGLGETGEYMAMAGSALVMGIFAVIGMEALTVLGLVAIPAIIFLSIATAMRAVSGVDGGFGALMAAVPADPIPWSKGVILVIGTWIFSAATCIADIMRYARNVKDAIVSAVISLVLGNSLLIICGAVTAFAVKESDLTSVLLKLGLVVPAIILMTTNIFTTNATNLYSNALGLSNVFRRAGKRKIFIGMLLFAIAMTFTRPYRIDALFSFLNMLGTVVPPLPGIILADFFILNKGRYPHLSTTNGLSVNWNACAAWAIGTVLVFVIPWGFPPLNGILLGAALYLGLQKIRPARKTTANTGKEAI